MSGCEYGDYIIYADESGDHSMNDVNQLYPVFVLAFCIFSKQKYLEEVVKQVKGFKFAFWGHDMTVLHSSKLRKRMDEFQFLHDQMLRAIFIEKLNVVIEASPFEIISMAIDKRHLHETLYQTNNPYVVSLKFCVEGIYQYLQTKNQDRKLTHIIIESRGKKEDKELQDVFDEIIEKQKSMQTIFPLRLIFAEKKTNNIGLQIADLIAYPIGRYLCNPKQTNLAFEIVQKKLLFPEQYNKEFKVFLNAEITEKRKTPEFSEV